MTGGISLNFIYDKLVSYHKEDNYPFHMPGHKRNPDQINFQNPLSIDITEIDGFDNLHHAEGIIKESEERAAALYGSEESHFLVNGSTSGLLSAISGCVHKGDRILMARNCHKAVYHAVFLNELEVQYIYPQSEPDFGLNGGLSPEKIEEMLIKDKNIKVVVITSPTYDGVVSNVKEIARVTHKYRIPLIVDEAHGAHFGFHDYFPESSVKSQADIVIHSLHKTLPSMTQTSMIHMNGDIINRSRVRKYLSIYQTSSPSYVLMSSIDKCIELLYRDREVLFDQYVKNLKGLRDSLSGLKYIRLAGSSMIDSFNIFDLDKSKLILSLRGLTMKGNELYHCLRKDYHLQMEMAAGDYVIGITSIGDREEGFIRLQKALYEIEKVSEFSYDKYKNDNNNNAVKNKIRMKISEAELLKQEKILLSESKGRISGEYIYLYPPGIPLIVPGEEISEEVLKRIEFYKECSLSVEGLEDKKSNNISVIF